MNTMTKRGTMFALALLMLVMSIFVPQNTAKAAMMYNNTNSASMLVSINTSGMLSAKLNVMGMNGKTTRIETSLYVEKKILGLFWTRVDIGYSDNTWHDTTTNYYYSHTFSCNLNSTGTYRVTVTYTVSGNGGNNDVITITDTATY